MGWTVPAPQSRCQGQSRWEEPKSMYSFFCLQGIQPGSLCAQPCAGCFTHTAIWFIQSLRSQGDFRPKVRKGVQGPKARVTYLGPWSPNCEDCPTLTRCPGLPRAGKGSLLNLSVVPMIPVRLCSVRMGHRSPLQDEQSASLLWAQVPTRGLAEK